MIVMQFRFPKLQLKFISKVFLLTLIITTTFSVGYFFGYQGFYASFSKFPEVNITRELPPEKSTLEFALFWRVWDTLSSKYYDKDKLIEAQMVYGAIKGMVASVGDPYTVFLPPQENRVVQEDLQGTFEGVGIQIGFKGTQLAVIAPLPGSPAADVGIKPGDFIIHIKDETKKIDIGTLGITLPEAVQAIRGQADSEVTLTLLREGGEEPIVVDIVRKSISIPSVTLEFVGEDQSIAHVKILKFSGDTQSEWEKYVSEILQKPNLKGIILDVRNNPGGFLQGAVDLTSDFLDNGKIVVIEDTGGKKSEYKVEKLGRFRKDKLTVLVNEGSASASEILAGAIKDHKRGKIVGETTFGKGTIQEPQQVNGGAGLHITIARWLTPGGFWVDEGGLKPDVEVEDNAETEEDEQLQEAIKVLNPQ